MEIRTLSPNASHTVAIPASQTSRTPSTSLRWVRRLGLVAATLALPLATGCAANFGAQTQVQYQPAVGSDDRDGDIYALNMQIVADASGDGTVVGTLINQKSPADRVTQFSAQDSKGAPFQVSTLPQSGIPLKTQQSVKLPDGANLQVSGSTLIPGGIATLSFRFDEAAPLDIEVPVVANTSMYDGITVGPMQSPDTTSATPSQ